MLELMYEQSAHRSSMLFDCQVYGTSTLHQLLRWKESKNSYRHCDVHNASVFNENPSCSSINRSENMAKYTCSNDLKQIQADSSSASASVGKRLQNRNRQCGVASHLQNALERKPEKRCTYSAWMHALCVDAPMLAMRAHVNAGTRHGCLQ